MKKQIDYYEFKNPYVNPPDNKKWFCFCEAEIEFRVINADIDCVDGSTFRDKDIVIDNYTLSNFSITTEDGDVLSEDSIPVDVLSIFTRAFDPVEYKEKYGLL